LSVEYFPNQSRTSICVIGSQSFIATFTAECNSTQYSEADKRTPHYCVIFFKINFNSSSNINVDLPCVFFLLFGV
jgi:hypothetical protein